MGRIPYLWVPVQRLLPLPGTQKQIGIWAMKGTGALALLYREKNAALAPALSPEVALLQGLREDKPPAALLPGHWDMAENRVTLGPG